MFVEILVILQEEARIQFDCEDIQGVEIESQGRNGPDFGHWEHRVVGVIHAHTHTHTCMNAYMYVHTNRHIVSLFPHQFQNEAMTGFRLFNKRYSRITFALFEDSG